MHVLIAYDISSHDTRYQFFKLLKNYGINVQRSVFECKITEYAFEKIKLFIINNIQKDKDKFLIMPICKHCKQNSFTQGECISLSVDSFKVI